MYRLRVIDQLDERAGDAMSKSPPPLDDGSDESEVYRPDLHDPEHDRIMTLTDGLDSFWDTRTHQEVQIVYQATIEAIRVLRAEPNIFVARAILNEFNRAWDHWQLGKLRPIWPVPAESPASVNLERSASKLPETYIAIRGRRLALECYERGITDPMILTRTQVAEWIGYSSEHSFRNAINQRKVTTDQLKAEAYRLIRGHLL
jgi:hypothetical protein